MEEKLLEVWEFDLDPEKLNKLSLADLWALDGYVGAKGEDKTHNFAKIAKAIKIKVNELK